MPSFVASMWPSDWFSVTWVSHVCTLSGVLHTALLSDNRQSFILCGSGGQIMSLSEIIIQEVTPQVPLQEIFMGHFDGHNLHHSTNCWVTCRFVIITNTMWIFFKPGRTHSYTEELALYLNPRCHLTKLLHWVNLE